MLSILERPKSNTSIHFLIVYLFRFLAFWLINICEHHLTHEAVVGTAQARHLTNQVVLRAEPGVV